MNQQDNPKPTIVRDKSKKQKEWYQKNKAKISAKAKIKYREDKKLGKTQHQLFMKSIQPYRVTHCPYGIDISEMK